MKILVLGNGFDVDHGLPTSYANFLSFCNSVVNIDLYPGHECFEKLDKNQKRYIEALNSNEELKNTFLKLLQHNHLFIYFNNRRDRSGRDWIDLEQEIAVVISEFKILENEYITFKYFRI